MASYVSSVMGWDFNLPAVHAVTAVAAPSTASASAGSIASVSATTAASGATSPGGFASSASEDGGGRRLTSPLTAVSMPPQGPFGGDHGSLPAAAAARSPASPGYPPSHPSPQHHVLQSAQQPLGSQGVPQKAPASPATPAEVTPDSSRGQGWPEANGRSPVRASPFSPTPAVQLNAHFNHPPVANGSLVRGVFAKANKQAAAAASGGDGDGGGALGGPEGTAAAAAAGPSSLHFSTSAPDLQHRRAPPAPAAGGGGPAAAGGAEAAAAGHGGDAACSPGSQRRNQRHVSFAQLPLLPEAEAVCGVGGGGEHGGQLYGSGGSVGTGGSVSPQGSGGGQYPCMPQRRGRFQVGGTARRANCAVVLVWDRTG